MWSILRRDDPEPAAPPPSPVGIVVTDDNVNPIIQMTTWLLIALTSLMLCFRILTRFFLKANSPFGLEEILIVSAFTFGLGESVTMLIPQSTIFGKEINNINRDELKTGIKVGYSRDILFILGLGFAKLSVCASFLALSPDQRHRRLTYSLAVLVLLWTISSCFASAFQCGTNWPWNSAQGRCGNQRAFLEYVGVTNLVTDMLLVALPVAIILPLNMPLERRAIVISFFTSRILAMVAVICQLIYIPRLFDDDFTLSAYPYYMSMQFVQFTSISTACIVYFWPLLRSLRSGLMWANNTTFAPHYALSRMRHTDASRGKTASSQDTLSSQSRERKDFIQITTEYAIKTDVESPRLPTRSELTGERFENVCICGRNSNLG